MPPTMNIILIPKLVVNRDILHAKMIKVGHGALPKSRPSASIITVGVIAWIN